MEGLDAERGSFAPDNTDQLTHILEQQRRRYWNTQIVAPKEILEDDLYRYKDLAEEYGLIVIDDDEEEELGEKNENLEQIQTYEDAEWEPSKNDGFSFQKREEEVTLGQRLSMLKSIWKGKKTKPEIVESFPSANPHSDTDSSEPVIQEHSVRSSSSSTNSFDAEVVVE